MKAWFRYLSIGLILGLFTEIQLKIVAGINPSAFTITLFAYPVLLTLAFTVHKMIDKIVRSTWHADLLAYFIFGIGGLAFEWTLLGNGPSSNAFQSGMFAMWTTFCFGPRVLTRDSPSIQKPRRRFWQAFAVVAVLQTVLVLAVKHPEPRLVIAVVGLSGSYIVWSLWLLRIAWRSNVDAAVQHPTVLKRNG